MDYVLCLESDICKAESNNEVVNPAFFDVERAYDMLWKEGLLVELSSLGVDSKIGKYNNMIYSIIYKNILQG